MAEVISVSTAKQYNAARERLPKAAALPPEYFVTPPLIPLARPHITQQEIDAVVAVLQSPHLSMGPKVAEFETAFARFCHTRHAVACSSGTTGLHLIVRAMGIGHGHEVITTPFSFVASANCMLMEGARPVFVDIEPDTWNIDPRRIEAAVTPKTKAVLPVDVFGQIADMDSIRKIAERRNLRIIEDSCEALGSSYRGRPAGSLGDMGVFGFYPNKQITTGEGGMIVTDDDALADLCRSMRNQGRDPGGSWLAHPRMGFNYRLSDIQCAIGIVQLERIEELLGARSRAYRWYEDCLAKEHRLALQKVSPHVQMSRFVCVVRLADRYTQSDRDRILKTLTARGIGCSNYFAPIHLQPFYVERFGYKPGDFPICESVAARTIALPFHHELTEADVDFICHELLQLL